MKEGPAPAAAARGPAAPSARRTGGGGAPARHGQVPATRSGGRGGAPLVGAGAVRPAEGRLPGVLRQPPVLGGRRRLLQPRPARVHAAQLPRVPPAPGGAGEAVRGPLQVPVV